MVETVEDDIHESEGESKRFGRFEIFEVLGRGGFGVVYRALDTSMRREVALKVPRFGEGERRKTKRFLAEARAVAKLRHPNIVPVFESGRVGERLYIAAEFVPGETLTTTLRRKHPDVRLAVEWTRTLCEAVAYAHEQGVVHRDIKPDNVMIDDRGQPQLMDFGLAKRLDEDSSLSVEGSVLGTPAYMSPEQARGEMSIVGPHSDQYSLGAMLYELLAGHRPYDGPPHVIVALAGGDTEPTPPSGHDPTVPRDVEAVCLKAMEKSPADRYESVSALGDDLRRWLDGVSVSVRRPRPWERVARWARRNPRLALLNTAVAALLVAVTGLSIGFAIYQSRTTDRLTEQAVYLAEARDEADDEKSRANAAADDAIKSATNLATEQKRRERIAYFDYIALANVHLRQGRPDRVGDELRRCAKEYRDWEFDYLSSVFRHARHKWEMETRDERIERSRLADLGSSETVDYEDLMNVDAEWCTAIDAQSTLCCGLTFTKNGDRILTGFLSGSQNVAIWDTIDGHQHTKLLTYSTPGINGRTPGGLNGLVLTPDETRVVGCFSSGVAHEWKRIDRRIAESRPVRGSDGTYSCIAIRPDGNRLALGTKVGVKILDAIRFDELAELDLVEEIVALDFSPDGRSLAVVSAERVSFGSVSLWDIESGKQLWNNTHCAPTCVDFGREGQRVIVGTRQGGLNLLDRQTGRSQGSRSSHTDRVNGIAVNPSGTRVATAGADGTVKIWALPELREVLTLEGHGTAVQRVAFGPSGRRLASGDDSGGIRLWQANWKK